MVIVILSLSIHAKASEEALSVVAPSLSFSGTTATCTLRVYADYTTDHIEASVKLMHGNSIVGQWNNLSDYGYLYFSDTVSAACPPHYFYNHTVISGYSTTYTHPYVYGYLEGGVPIMRNCTVTEYHDIWMYSCAVCGAIYEEGGWHDEVVNEVHSAYHN